MRRVRSGDNMLIPVISDTSSMTQSRQAELNLISIRHEMMLLHAIHLGVYYNTSNYIHNVGPIYM